MICRNWQQGSCVYGEGCRYSHAGPPGSGGGRLSGPPGRGNVCRDFARGLCRYGDACRYIHSMDGDGGKGQGGRGKGFERATRQGFGKGMDGKGSQRKGPGQAPGDVRSLTGPYLGKGSELLKVWFMPDNQGHDDGIFTATVMNDRVCTGSKDQRLLVWVGQRTADGRLKLEQDNEVAFTAGVSSLLFHAESKWLFCGLMDGVIKAYRQEPMMDTTLAGHGAPVTSMLIHESVLLSGSHDGSIRAWQFDAASNSFRCAAAMQCPLGQVFKLHVHLGGSLWVGAQRGLTCFNLQALQPQGNIESPARVVGLVPYQESIIAAFADGVIKVFDGTGREQFSHGPLGEHTTNTTVGCMRHPRANKDLLLCGQEYGYVTVYEIPDFRPRGSFCTGYDGEVMAIVDMGCDGIFVTCGLSGDVTIWRWSEEGVVMSTSPF